MYGLTECKRVGFLPTDLIDEHPASVGRAMANCEAIIIDEKGEEVRSGETGEHVVRGSNVMQGYWNDLEASRQAFRAGRYPADRILHTGDWFCLGDDGDHSLAQEQDEFFFVLPYEKMDACVCGESHGIPPDEIAAATALGTEQVIRIYRSIATRRARMAYLRARPILPV